MYRECDSVVSSQTTPALVVWRIKTEYPGLRRILLITYHKNNFIELLRSIFTILTMPLFTSNSPERESNNINTVRHFNGIYRTWKKGE